MHRPDVVYPRPLPASRGGHAVGLADLGDLPRVVVPVVVEHGAHVYRQGDLVGPHELLEQGNLRLPPQIGVGERFEITEDLTALSLEPTNRPAFEALQNDVREVLFITHTVRPGDTCVSLAELYYGDKLRCEVIAETNRMALNAQLKAGQKIRVPEIPGVPFRLP